MVLEPPEFVAVSLTENVPALVYTKRGFRTVESTTPSFWKSQAQAFGPPDEVSVNWTLSGAEPLVGMPVKPATGGGVAPDVETMSSGESALSRLAYSALSLLVFVIPKLYVPLAGTAALTSNSTQVPVVTAPTLDSFVPEMTGALFQTMPVSVQVFATV